MIRIVQMTFKVEHTDDFIELFNEIKQKIRAHAGCNKLSLLQDKKNPQIFFTYSYWDSETDLNHYRHSPLFDKTWTTVKQWFDDKPRAWSVNELEQL